STADPGGTVTLTGSVRYLGNEGQPLTYDINQIVSVDADGNWRAQLVFGEKMGDQAGMPIPLTDTSEAQLPYTLTATWSRGGANASDAATISVDSAAPDMLQVGGWTAERLVNTFVPGNQCNPRVASLRDGGYVIIWSSEYHDNPNEPQNIGL